MPTRQTAARWSAGCQHAEALGIGTLEHGVSARSQAQATKTETKSAATAY